MVKEKEPQFLIKCSSVFHKHVKLNGGVDRGLFIKDSSARVHIYQEDK